MIYKIGDRDTSKYKELTRSSVLSLEKAIEAYRVITGACAPGTKRFVGGLSEVKQEYTVAEIVDLTAGRYGNDTFRNFFATGAEIERA